MLKPAYNNRKDGCSREKGISLSRTSSLQKFSEIAHKKQFQSINQSFDCFEPQSILNPLEDDRKVQQNNQNPTGRMSLKNRKGISHKNQRNNYLNVLGNSKRHNIIQSQQSLFLLPETQSIGEMINLLLNYQKVCQSKRDLPSAQQARHKINELRKQQLNTRRKQLELEEKSQAYKTKREVDNEVQEFHEFWDAKIAEAVSALKDIQNSNLKQQKQDFEQFQKSVLIQPAPRVRYSSKILEIQRNLTSLIKSRKYKQAQHLRILLQKKQSQQQQKHVITFNQKKQARVREFRKRQQKQLQVLRIRLSAAFNQLLVERDRQQSRLTKKMKKKQIQGNKIPAGLLRARTQLENQGKAKIDKVSR